MTGKICAANSSANWTECLAVTAQLHFWESCHYYLIISVSCTIKATVERCLLKMQFPILELYGGALWQSLRVERLQ